jgi:hypothetical protein
MLLLQGFTTSLVVFAIARLAMGVGMTLGYVALINAGVKLYH